MTALQAACIAAWLTGMVPIAAYDACGAIPVLRLRNRPIFYLGWPFLVAMAALFVLFYEEQDA